MLAKQRTSVATKGILMGQLVITKPQQEYIENLCAELGYSIQFALSEGLFILHGKLHQLTRKEASELIGWLRDEKG